MGWSAWTVADQLREDSSQDSCMWNLLASEVTWMKISYQQKGENALKCKNWTVKAH